MKCTENKHPQNQSQICHQKLNPQSIPKKTTKIRQSFLQQSHPYIKVKNRLKIKIRFGNQRRINASFVHTQKEYCCVTRDEWERNNWIHAKKSKKKKKKSKSKARAWILHKRSWKPWKREIYDWEPKPETYLYRFNLWLQRLQINEASRKSTDLEEERERERENESTKREREGENQERRKNA